MLWYTKTIVFWVKSLNIVAECCLNWIFFNGALYCCVRYKYQISNMKMRSSKIIIKNIAQKVMAKSSLGHRFHDLRYFEVGFLFQIH